MAKKKSPSEMLLNPTTVPDQIVGVATQIEALREDKEAVYQQIRDVSDGKALSDFVLGGLLSVANASKWYKEDGYDSFKEFLKEEFPAIEYRKANYLINMYDSLVEAEVEWEDVKDIGWTKLSRLAQVLDKENAKSWIKRARKCSTVELLGLIKESKQSGDGTKPPASEPVKKKSFTLHEDQAGVVEDAVQKAKEDMGTEYEGVALDAICQNFLTGDPIEVTGGNLKEMMEEAGIQAVADLMNEIWPHIEVTIAMGMPDDDDGKGKKAKKAKKGKKKKDDDDWD